LSSAASTKRFGTSSPAAPADRHQRLRSDLF
jgi:hypothetical protein